MTRVAWLAAPLLVMTALSYGSGCGGPSGGGECVLEPWRGRCTLQRVDVLRRIERFPKAFIVAEAIYQPEAVVGQMTPPAVATQMTVPADQESALRDHLHRQPTVECSGQTVKAGLCEAPALEVAVAPFQPVARAKAEGPTGCAQIEQREHAESSAGGQQLPGTFEFEASSATPAGLMTSDANDAARAIAADPTIECVAVSGQVAVGEDYQLADARAKVVVDLLVSRGVPRNKLVVFRGTQPVFSSANPQDRIPMPEHRRVRLSVVIRGRGAPR